MKSLREILDTFKSVFDGNVLLNKMFARDSIPTRESIIEQVEKVIRDTRNFKHLEHLADDILYVINQESPSENAPYWNLMNARTPEAKEEAYYLYFELQEYKIQYDNAHSDEQEETQDDLGLN